MLNVIKRFKSNFKDLENSAATLTPAYCLALRTVLSGSPTSATTEEEKGTGTDKEEDKNGLDSLFEALIKIGVALVLREVRSY